MHSETTSPAFLIIWCDHRTGFPPVEWEKPCEPLLRCLRNRPMHVSMSSCPSRWLSWYRTEQPWKPWAQDDSLISLGPWRLRVRMPLRRIWTLMHEWQNKWNSLVLNHEIWGDYLLLWLSLPSFTMWFKSLQQWVSTRGNFIPPGDICQCVETFLVAMNGDSGGSIGRFATKHPAEHMTVPYNQELSRPKWLRCHCYKTLLQGA